jgi:hypothetical protein
VRHAAFTEHLYTGIHDVLGPNLEMDTDYPALCLSWFSSGLPDKCRDEISIRL